MADHDNPGNPEVVSGDAIINFLMNGPAIEKQEIVFKPELIEVPKLFSTTGFLMTTGPLVLAGSIVAGSLGVPLPLIIGGALVINMGLYTLLKRKEWL